MIVKLKEKNLRGFLDDSYIVKHYLPSYSANSDNRYKHIETISLYDNKTIKATMSPIDLNIIPYNGIATYIVTSAEENRIDLISLKFYGASKFYWAICYMNNIADPLNVPVGTPLIIPDISCLKKYPNPLY